MKKFTITLAALIAIAGLGACNKDKKEEAPASKESTSVDTTTKTTDTGTEAKTEVTTTDKGGSVTGVAECDVFISKYEKCLMEKAPEAARAMMKSAFDQQRDAWIQAASTPEGKQTLAIACTTALNSAKQSMAAYNCEW